MQVLYITNPFGALFYTYDSHTFCSAFTEDDAVAYPTEKDKVFRQNHRTAGTQYQFE